MSNILFYAGVIPMFKILLSTLQHSVILTSWPFHSGRWCLEDLTEVFEDSS